MVGIKIFKVLNSMNKTIITVPVGTVTMRMEEEKVFGCVVWLSDEVIYSFTQQMVIRCLSLQMFLGLFFHTHYLPWVFACPVL